MPVNDLLMPVYSGLEEGVASSAAKMSRFSDEELSHLGGRAIGFGDEFLNLMTELKSQNYDVIRFATYRTACKLRFLQKKTSLYLVDIWNMIEAFRENGLNSLDGDMNGGRLETLLSSVFYQLNKRLPHNQQIDLETSTAALFNWFTATYDPEENGKVLVFSIKIALSVMCAGKLVDKLRYIYSLLSENNGQLGHTKFGDFLQAAMALPCSVCESPSFGYVDSIPASIFDPHSKVTVNDFLDTFVSDPSPPCLMWLSLLHRLANVENVVHPIQCDGCNRDSFLGFRYKCQRCYSYQLCQDCFWRGRTSGSHSNQHEMKEYTSYKSATKQLGHSLKKSFRCVPEKQLQQAIPRFPAEPEKTLNLSHIVPPSPILSHNGLLHSYDTSSLDSHRLHSKSFQESSREDEHRLIVGYAARLADTENNSCCSIASPTSTCSLPADSSSSRQKHLISQLESKNREIMREIMRLRKQQEREEEEALQQSERNPTLLAELRGLRNRKDELEKHLATLQESRRQLMLQLEALMKLLKNHQACSPPRSTSKSPPLSTPYPLSSLSLSAPTTPGSSGGQGVTTTDSLTGVGGDVRMAFGHRTSNGSEGPTNASTPSLMRNNLLVAVDSVTNAMSSLVRELNSGSEDEEDATADNSKAFSSSRAISDLETEDTESVDGLEGDTLWREERRKAQEDSFLAEIQAREKAATPPLVGATTPPPTLDQLDPTIQCQDEESADDELYDDDPKLRV